MLLKTHDGGKTITPIRRVRGVSQRYPHPGCFVERVWICLIPKGLSMLAWQRVCKSIGVKELGGFRRDICRADMWNVIILVYGCQGFFGESLRLRAGKGFNGERTEGGAQRRSSEKIPGQECVAGTRVDLAW